MPTYILLLTLDPEGRKKILRDPESVLRAGDAIRIPGTQLLGLYGVLSDCDFVAILEAPGNEAAAMFSVELGVRAGVHVTSMPAIPIGRFASRPSPRSLPAEEAGAPLEFFDEPRSSAGTGGQP